MNTIKARFDGRVFVPEMPVDLPVGCELEIVLPESSATNSDANALDELAQLLQHYPENPNWPANGAAEHDHYLYGTPIKPG